jgi:hypothetical protein
VDHLKSADSIIRISTTDSRAIQKIPSEMGNIESGGYSSLDSDDAEARPSPVDVSDEVSVDLGTSDVEIIDEARDLDRNTGDLEIYSYYLRYVGAFPLLVFVFFAALNTISGSFSSKM